MGTSVALWARQVLGEFVSILLALSMATIALVSSYWIARKIGLAKNITPITVAQVVRAVQEGSWSQPAR